MTNICKIVSVGIPSEITKKDGTTCLKQTIILRELGGKFENSFVTTLFADEPCKYPPGTAIAAALRFQTREYEGNQYQDVVLQEYQLIGFPPIQKPNELPQAPNMPQIPQVRL